MSGNSHGGNDTFNKTGGEESTFYGDAGGNMSDHAHGGNDSFEASSAQLSDQDLFYGDAGGTMGDEAVGGDDTYVGGNVRATLGNASMSEAFGDAQSMSGNAHGGDDTLTGGNDSNPPPAATFETLLVGDSQTMSGNASGGNDKLISGTGNDDMWGDAKFITDFAQGGNDTFVFNFDNGHDTIEDLGQGVSGAGPSLGVDHVDVSALGITDFSHLNITAFDPTTHESTITFSQGNDVVVHSQEALRPQDFIFAHDFLLT